MRDARASSLGNKMTCETAFARSRAHRTLDKRCLLSTVAGGLPLTRHWVGMQPLFARFRRRFGVESAHAFQKLTSCVPRTTSPRLCARMLTLAPVPSLVCAAWSNGRDTHPSRCQGVCVVTRTRAPFPNAIPVPPGNPWDAHLRIMKETRQPRTLNSK